MAYLICMVIGGFIGYLINPIWWVIGLGVFVGWLVCLIAKNGKGDISSAFDSLDCGD